MAAVHNNVGIMDIAAFTKVEVTGTGAAEALQRLVANRLPRKDGGVFLTHVLNRRGQIETKVTVIRLAEDRYYLVCAAFFEQRLLDHLANHGGDGLTVINRSPGWAALALQGPKSRADLAEVTDAPLNNAGFRWPSARHISIPGHDVWALRMSYANQLKWELTARPKTCLPSMMLYGLPAKRMESPITALSR